MVSDLAGHTADSLRIGFGPEFGRRPDGFPGLARAYGLELRPIPRRDGPEPPLPGPREAAPIDVAAGDSTDGRIATLDLFHARRRPPVLPSLMRRSPSSGPKP